MAAPDDRSQQERLAQARFEQEQADKLLDAYNNAIKQHAKATQDYIDAGDAIANARKQGLDAAPYSEAGVNASRALREAKKIMDQAELAYNLGRESAKKVLDEVVLDREQLNKDQVEGAQLIVNQAEKGYQAAINVHSHAIEVHDKAFDEYNNIKAKIVEARKENKDEQPLREEGVKAAQALRAAIKASSAAEKAMQNAEQDYSAAAEKFKDAMGQRKQVLEKRIAQEPQAMPLPDFKKPNVEPPIPTAPDIAMVPNAEVKAQASVQEGVYKKAFGKEMLQVNVGPKDENGQRVISFRFDDSLGRPSRNVEIAKFALGFHEEKEIEIKKLQNPKHLEHIVNAAKEMRAEGLLKKPINADAFLKNMSNLQLRSDLQQLVKEYNQNLDPSATLVRKGPGLSG